MNLGPTTIHAHNLGSTASYRVYLGSTLVFGSAAEATTASLTIQFEDATAGADQHRIYLDGLLAVTLDAADTEHVLTGLAWDTDYSVMIRAYDGTNESTSLTAVVWTPPTEPPTIEAAAGDENSIALTLTPPATPPSGTNAGTGYSIEQSADGTTGWAEIEVVAVGQQPATVTGLTGNTEYFFRARSVNANPSPHDDGLSAYSATTSATVIASSTFFFTSSPVISEVGVFQFVSSPIIELYAA